MMKLPLPSSSRYLRSPQLGAIEQKAPSAASSARWLSPRFWTLAVISSLAAAWLLHHQLLLALGGVLVARDSLEPADIVFVLNGGENTRPFQAAALYRAGLAPEIVIARDDSISRSTNCPGCLTSEMSERILRFCVPNSHIVELQIPGGVKTTFDEAHLCFAYSRSRRIKNIIVVTSDFHTRRTKWIFDRVFSGTPVKIMVDATRNGRYSVSNWWLRQGGRHDCWKEYLKLAYCRYGLILPATGTENMKIVHQ
jgi:uncharacterized SAM-binding protein YcdF (DUF218 family)